MVVSITKTFPLSPLTFLPHIQAYLKTVYVTICLEKCLILFRLHSCSIHIIASTHSCYWIFAMSLVNLYSTLRQCIAAVEARLAPTPLSPSLLLLLPAEVRVEIYKQVLQPKRWSHEQVRNGTSHDRLLLPGGMNPVTYGVQGCTNILLLCRQIFNECQPIMRQIPQRLRPRKWIEHDGVITGFQRKYRLQDPPFAFKFRDMRIQDAAHVEYLTLDISAEVSHHTFSI